MLVRVSGRPTHAIQDDGAEHDIIRDLRRSFGSQLWQWHKMVALPLPVAMLDDVTGSGNKVIQDGDRKVAILRHRHNRVQKSSLYYLHLST